MGNPISADVNERVRLFASPQSWIEGAALRQLEQLAERNGVESVAGMPDLHPGISGPVGCAALSRNIVHPDAVGTDMGLSYVLVFWLAGAFGFFDHSGGKLIAVVVGVAIVLAAYRYADRLLNGGEE